MRELDPISEALNHLRELDPNLGKRLTKEVSNHSSDARERKRRKLDILVERHRPVLDEIAKRMYPTDMETSSPLGYSSKSLITSIHHLIKMEREGGSFGSKYDYNQGPVE